jgi:hypothetical protein
LRAVVPLKWNDKGGMAATSRKLALQRIRAIYEEFGDMMFL